MAEISRETVTPRALAYVGAMQAQAYGYKAETWTPDVQRADDETSFAVYLQMTPDERKAADALFEVLWTAGGLARFGRENLSLRTQGRIVSRIRKIWED